MLNKTHEPLKFLILCLSLVIQISCSGRQTDLTFENTNAVIALIVDTYAKKLPPPPAPEFQGNINNYNKANYDSVSTSASSLTVMIDPILHLENFSEYIKNQPDEYINLKHQIESDSIVNIDSIYSTKGHQIIVADQELLNKPLGFKEYYWLFSFSKIYFNKDYSKSMVLVGIQNGPFNGSLTFVGLNKVNNQWAISYTQELEIS